MSERERYSVETDLEEAEARARELPDQIARLRDQVREAKSFLRRDQRPSSELSEQ